MDVTKFKDLNLHDSEILSIIVKYVSPDIRQVDLLLDYIDCYQPLKTSKKVLRFYGCYKIRLNLNLDVIAPESILEGKVIQPSALRQHHENQLRKVGGSLPESLKHFQVITNSIAGTLDVLSTGVDLLDADSTKT